jgi:hypothetical protein
MQRERFRPGLARYLVRLTGRLADEFGREIKRLPTHRAAHPLRRFRHSPFAVY